MPLGYHSQKLGLRGGRHLGHFIEEEGSFMGSLEEPLPAAVRAREGPFFMSKKLALEQRLCEGRTVYGYEGLRRAGAVFVDRPGHQLLAGAGFAGN